MKVLIVRLGSLGDIVHALPAAAALRRAFPTATIDWVVDERNRGILDLVPILDERIVFHASTRAAWRDAARVIARLRRARYDLALDLQGLLKSAVLARASGARRVVGFSKAHLREPAARVFYTETRAPAGATHVIEKNLRLAQAVGAEDDGLLEFPLVVSQSSVPGTARERMGIGRSEPYALINPCAAWPNKQWPPDRFGLLARHIHAHHGLRPAVLWGPGEAPLAAAVQRSSAGAAVVAPGTTVADLVALVREARLVVSGDTGPLHIASALQVPVVGIYGPTDPRRNGPWAPGDVTISRFTDCQCHHRRRCTARAWCLADVATEEVIGAVDRRLDAPRSAQPC